MSMTNSENSKCHAIIHSAAVAAGAIGAGLAQIPLSDNLLIMPIQIGMVTSLGNVFGKSLTESTIKSLIASASATVIGRSASQALLGWIPLLGNAINASTAFTLTEAIGWVIANNFADEAEQEKQRVAEEEHRKAEELRIEQENKSSPVTPVKLTILQILSTVYKFLLGIVKFLCSIPKWIAYAVSGIWRALRGLVGMLWGLLSGNAFNVLKTACFGIWNAICAFVGTVFNAAIFAVVASGIMWVIAKMNLLSPEYLALLRDFLNFIK